MIFLLGFEKFRVVKILGKNFTNFAAGLPAHPYTGISTNTSVRSASCPLLHCTHLGNNKSILLAETQRAGEVWLMVSVAFPISKDCIKILLGLVQSGLRGSSRRRKGTAKSKRNLSSDFTFQYLLLYYFYLLVEL